MIIRIIKNNLRKMSKRKLQKSESEGSSDEAGGPTRLRRLKPQQENAAAAARETSTDAAENFRTAVTALQGLNSVVLQAVLNATVTNNQISVAANSMVVVMVGE